MPKRRGSPRKKFSASANQEPTADVRLLPSPLPGRSPTVWFERQVGAPQRTELCPEAASALLEPPGRLMCMRLELNANSVRLQRDSNAQLPRTHSWPGG